MCVCVIRSIYTYTHYNREKNSKLESNTPDETTNSKKRESERYIEQEDMMKDNDEWCQY